MPIESPVNQISDLNENWPLGSDTRSTLDDHCRLIKKAVRSLLTNPAQLNYPPSGLAQAGAQVGQVLMWNGNQWAPGTVSGGGGGGGGATPFMVQTSNFLAASNYRYYLKANNITMTLPANPSDGDWVEVIGSATGCTIARNGRNIMGLAENMELDTSYYAIKLVFIAADNDWRIAP